MPVVPIVFAAAADPVGVGYVESLARAGGNVTGFTGYEFAPSRKWLELLKEIARRVTQAAVLGKCVVALLAVRRSNSSARPPLCE